MNKFFYFCRHPIKMIYEWWVEEQIRQQILMDDLKKSIQELYLQKQTKKTFITEVTKKDSVRLNTGSGKDYIEIIFDGMTSKNMLRVIFRLSENVVVEKVNKT